jgi:hypothetical protein
MNTWMSCSWISRSTSLTALNGPYCFERPRVDITIRPDDTAVPGRAFSAVLGLTASLDLISLRSDIIVRSFRLDR